MEYRKWKKAYLRENKEQRQKAFLADCKYFGITPKFLRIENEFIKNTFRKETEVFERKIIGKLIRKKYAEIAKTKKQKMDSERILTEISTEDKMKFYREKVAYIAKKEEKRHSEKLRKKLKFWMERKGIKNFKKEKEQEFPYINLSEVKMNAFQDILLKKGPKYIIEDNIDLRDTIPKIENVIENVPSSEREKWRNEIQNDLDKKMKESDRNKEDRKALASLKKRKDLTFLHTDKTGKLVIMNSKDYTKKMEEAIKGLHVEKIEHDPNKKLTEKVKLLLKEGSWPGNKKPKGELIAANTPRAFGRLKDHKTPNKMRPIVSKREGPTYILERFMRGIYQELLPESEHVVHSTTAFIKVLRELKIEEKDKIVSFDVKELYPSIDTLEIEKMIESKIEEVFDENTEVAKTLKRTNSLLLRENYFSFRNTFYKQTKGLPMGSPISGVLADLKMRNLEEIIMNSCKDKIKYWYRYVDDIFAVIDQKSDPKEILKVLNKFDKNIQFTLEEEERGVINFLDVKLKREKGEAKIKTTVYRKPTAANQIINAACRTPLSYKLSAIRSYINRAINICSDQGLLNKEIYKIEEIAVKAGYSRSTVNKIYRDRIKKLEEEINPGQREKRKFTNAIPFNRGTAIKIARRGREKGLIIPIKPNKSIFQRIRNEKDNFDEKETPGIYRIEFENKSGEKGIYIGVTKRKIKERLKEHKADIKFGRTGTALAQKNSEEEIKIEFESAKKIANYVNHNYAYRRESVEIALEEKAVNAVEHAHINARWRNMLKRGSQSKERNTTSKKDGTCFKQRGLSNEEGS